jgi:hypothetical protein
MLLEIKITNNKMPERNCYLYTRLTLLRIMLYKLIIFSFHYSLLRTCMFPKNVYFYFPTYIICQSILWVTYSHDEVSNLL